MTVGIGLLPHHHITVTHHLSSRFSFQTLESELSSSFKDHGSSEGGGTNRTTASHDNLPSGPQSDGGAGPVLNGAPHSSNDPHSPLQQQTFQQHLHLTMVRGNLQAQQPPSQPQQQQEQSPAGPVLLSKPPLPPQRTQQTLQQQLQCARKICSHPLNISNEQLVIEEEGPGVQDGEHDIGAAMPHVTPSPSAAAAGTIAPAGSASASTISTSRPSVQPSATSAFPSGLKLETKESTQQQSPSQELFPRLQLDAPQAAAAQQQSDSCQPPQQRQGSQEIPAVLRESRSSRTSSTSGTLGRVSGFGSADGSGLLPGVTPAALALVGPWPWW